VLNAAERLDRDSFDVRVIPVDSGGLIDLGTLVTEVDHNTCLVSIQLANNEIGTIQAIEEIAQVVHRVGAVFHTDAAQALGRIRINVGTLGVDLMSLSAHKCYGPKGIGALYVRAGARSAPIEPLAYGGGQEYDLRPGTLNVPGIVGFGLAAELASGVVESESGALRPMRDRLETLILERLDRVHRNGCIHRRLAGNSSLTFNGADAEAIIANLPGIAVSTGSACSHGAIDPSHVLTAIGLTRDQAHQTIRFGLGRYTMPHEIDYVAERVVAAVKCVRATETASRNLSDPFDRVLSERAVRPAAGSRQ
jgi:cysteine desulfurase